ncbi:MAG: hypothetical protein FWG63_00985 [Defluviitaleaceae bacterium]|nr:hypothetical protein [Defluviitaleaceae bacterium]
MKNKFVACVLVLILALPFTASFTAFTISPTFGLDAIAIERLSNTLNITNVSANSGGIIITLADNQPIDLGELVLELVFIEDPTNLWDSDIRIELVLALDTNWAAATYQDNLVLTLDTASILNINLGQLALINILYRTESQVNAIFSQELLHAWGGVRAHDIPDFNTAEERLLFEIFQLGFEYLLPFVHPINQTFYYNGIELGLMSSIVLEAADGGMDGYLFMYIGGDVEWHPINWHNSVTVFINQDPQGWLPWAAPSLMRFLDEETGYGYFAVFVNYWSMDDDIEQILLDIVFTELTTDISVHSRDVNLNLPEVLAGHTPTFIEIDPMLNVSQGIGRVWQLDNYEGDLGELEFLLNPNIIAETGLLTPGQLNIPLGDDVYLTNAALDNNVLRIQIRELWTGVLSATTPALGTSSGEFLNFLESRSFQWPQISSGAYNLNEATEIYTEMLHYIGDLSRFDEWLPGAIDIADIHLSIFGQDIEAVTPFNVSFSVEAPIARPPTLFADGMDTVIQDIPTHISNIALSIHQLSLQLFYQPLVNDPEFQRDAFGLLRDSISIVFEDGTTQLLWWSSASLSTPDWNPRAIIQEYAQFHFRGFAIDIDSVVGIIINDVEVPLNIAQY